jgi:hypothetical protein
MEHVETTFENKEIRGITLRQIIGLFLFLATILISVVMTYSSITNKLDRVTEQMLDLNSSKKFQEQLIQNLKDNQENQNKAFQLQLQTMEIRVVKLETEVTK